MLTLLARHFQPQTILLPKPSFYQASVALIEVVNRNLYVFPPFLMILKISALNVIYEQCEILRLDVFQAIVYKIGFGFFQGLIHTFKLKAKTDQRQTYHRWNFTSFYDLMHILKRSLKENPFDYSKKNLGNRLVCRLQNAKKGVMHEQRWCVASCLVRAVSVRQQHLYHHHTRSMSTLSNTTLCTKPLTKHQADIEQWLGKIPSGVCFSSYPH